MNLVCHHILRGINILAVSYTHLDVYKRQVNNWAKGASARQKEIPTPAVARTWITAYDTPYWNPKVIYNASKIEDQVRALYDAGLDGGFITWNSASRCV